MSIDRFRISVTLLDCTTNRLINYTDIRYWFKVSINRAAAFNFRTDRQSVRDKLDEHIYENWNKICDSALHKVIAICFSFAKKRRSAGGAHATVI